jgi:hypothetical protein
MPLNLELELTTKCNASCPQCVRNFYGGPKWPSLPLISSKLEFLKDKLGDFLHEIDGIKLCGTYGDPCVHNEIVEIVKWLVTYPNLNITINTNGGMDKNHWRDLAKVLSTHGYVTFGIDGLEDTNHLYRKNVDWNILMRNVKNFIDAGGVAAWQFIVFEHNQHQVEQAKELSEKLGFKYFFIKKTIRFINKEHKSVEFNPVVHKNKVYYLKPPTDEKYLFKGYQPYKNINLKTVDIECTAKKINHLYIGADGYVFPCGWLHDRLYGYEPERQGDNVKMFKLMELAGGKEKANIKHTPIKEIINGEWFRILEESWTNENRLERCAVQCHKGNFLVNNVYQSLTKDVENNIVLPV